MKENFYERCAEILGVDYDGSPFPYRKRTRWNNRVPGQGRYHGYGVIRDFGGIIHLAFSHPPNNKQFTSQEECLEFLRNLKAQL